MKLRTHRGVKIQIDTFDRDVSMATLLTLDIFYKKSMVFCL